MGKPVIMDTVCKGFKAEGLRRYNPNDTTPASINQNDMFHF